MSKSIAASSLVIVVTALVAVNGVKPAHAQNAVEGIWSTTLTARDDLRWRLEDHLCGTCRLAMYQHLQEMLADPRNDNRPLREIQQEARATDRNLLAEVLTEFGRAHLQRPGDAGDTSLLCEPPDLFEIVVGSPLPLRIDVREDRVLLRQEHWNVTREIPLGRPLAVSNEAASRYGNATARFDGDALVIETANILPMSLRGPVTSEKARLIERYTPREQMSRLDIEVTVVDPETFNEPQTWYRPRIRTPEVELFDDDPCAGLDE